MAAPDINSIFVGAPDQQTTGAILSGPKDLAVPASITETLPTDLVGSGYVSDEGLTLTPERSTETIRDWSGKAVRRLLTEFDGTLAWQHLEMNEEALKNYFGDNNVSVTAATTTSGTQTKSELRGEELPTKTWAFKMKDGQRKILIFVPRGQVTEQGEVSFISSDAVRLPVTLTTFPDENGVNAYILTDDGVFTASTT